MNNICHRKSSIAQSLNKLKYDCNMTESSLQAVQNWAENVVQESVRTVIGGIKSVLPTISSEVHEILQLGLGLANPFGNMRTELQRKHHLPCYIVSTTLSPFGKNIISTFILFKKFNFYIVFRVFLRMFLIVNFV